MKEKTCYDGIEYRTSDIMFKAHHENAPNQCCYLALDCEEHPNLDKTDLKELGLQLVDFIEDYIDKKDKFVLEEHSSSTHVKHKGKTIAKIWNNIWKNSDIRNQNEGLKVAQQFKKLIKTKDSIEPMPRLKRVCDTDFPYAIRSNCTVASFMYENDADKYMDEFVMDKYGQKIVSNCSVVALENTRKSGYNVEIFLNGEITRIDAENILYHLREYIKTEIMGGC